MGRKNFCSQDILRVEAKSAGKHPRLYKLTAHNKIASSQMLAVLRLSNLVESLVSLLAPVFSARILIPKDLILEYLS